MQRVGGEVPVADEFQAGGFYGFLDGFGIALEQQVVAFVQQPFDGGGEPLIAAAMQRHEHDVVGDAVLV